MVRGVDATAAVDGRQENVDYKYVDHECVQENAAAQGSPGDDQGGDRDVMSEGVSRRPF
jgi:hypothetical protein